MLATIVLVCVPSVQAAVLAGTARQDRRFGESVASAGDLNGDGKCDWLVADSATGFAWAISGADVKPIFHVGTRGSGRGGFTNVSSLGDVDGDRTPDILVSAGRLSGQPVRAYSGKDAHVLFSSPGEWAAPVGDVDRDGKADFVATSVTFPGKGVRSTTVLMEVRSGADGSLLRELRRVDEAGFNFMVRTVSLGDGDGDGVGDWAAIFLERIVVFSGRTGDELLAFGKHRDLPPLSICKLSDVDGDKAADILVTHPPRDDSGFPGALLVHSGTDGHILQVHEQPWGLARAFARTIADIDGDGRVEFAIVSYSDLGGVDSVSIYSGDMTGHIRSLSSSDMVENGGETAVTAVPDVDGDGVQDLLVGYPSSLRECKARIYSGETSGLLRVISPEKLGAQWAARPR